MLYLLTARRESIDKRESVPRPTIPSGRSDRANYEDAQNAHAQSAHLRVRLAAKVPHQAGRH